MTTLADRWATIWQRIQGSPANVIRSITIPPGDVMGSEWVSKHINPGEHYFAVTLNEMFLTEARRWMDVVDPMAIFVTEFTYNGKLKSVPFVVGPSLIEKSVKQVPNGMSFTDTLVGGIHPYAGGTLALTVILAQVPRSSYPKQLLHVIEKVTSSFPSGQALEAHLKVADAVLDGIDALFGGGATIPLAGHRWEYNDGTSPWLEPGFFALVGSGSKLPTGTKLAVDKGRLMQSSSGSIQEFRAADFLLYSVQPIVARTDITGLQFYRTFLAALHDAGGRDKASWERAKSGLVKVHQELLTSPDLVWSQVQELMASFKQKLIQAHEQAKSFATLSTDVPPESNGQVKVFAAFETAEAALRLNELDRVHELLALE